MLPRPLDWHHRYLALGSLSASLGVVFFLLARDLVLPLALLTMGGFSLTALANAAATRTDERSSDRVSTGRTSWDWASTARSVATRFDEDDRR